MRFEFPDVCRSSARKRQSCDRSFGASASSAGLLRFSFQLIPGGCGLASALARR
jgi:hypothetical protein